MVNTGRSSMNPAFPSYGGCRLMEFLVYLHWELQSGLIISRNDMD